VAVDTLGAGVGDFVLIVQGSSARFTPETQKLPVDCVVIGIVDSVNIEKKTIYHRQNEA
jgi:ethanolamine utilization protein EutN